MEEEEEEQEEEEEEEKTRSVKDNGSLLIVGKGFMNKYSKVLLGLTPALSRRSRCNWHWWFLKAISQ